MVLLPAGSVMTSCNFTEKQQNTMDNEKHQVLTVLCWLRCSKCYCIYSYRKQWKSLESKMLWIVTSGHVLDLTSCFSKLFFIHVSLIKQGQMHSNDSWYFTGNVLCCCILVLQFCHILYCCFYGCRY